jgi:hypothetical protein
MGVGASTRNMLAVPLSLETLPTRWAAWTPYGSISAKKSTQSMKYRVRFMGIILFLVLYPEAV